MLQDQIVLGLPDFTEIDHPRLADQADAHGFRTLEISCELLVSDESNRLDKSIQRIVYLGNLDDGKTSLTDLKRLWHGTMEQLHEDAIQSVNIGLQTTLSNGEREELQSFFQSLPVEGMLTVADVRFIPNPFPESIDRLQLPVNPLEQEWRSIIQQYDVPIRGYDLTCGGLLTEEYAQLDENVKDPQMEKHHPDFSKDRPRYVRVVKEIKQWLQSESPVDLPLEFAVAGWALNTDVESIRWPYQTPEDLATLTRLDDFTRNEQHVASSPNIENIKNSNPPHFVKPPPYRPIHAPERYKL